MIEMNLMCFALVNCNFHCDFVDHQKGGQINVWRPVQPGGGQAAQKADNPIKSWTCAHPP